MSTTFNLPIENLSLADKLLLMERLWEDLSRRPADLISPEWHGDVLAQREAAVQEGRSTFVDWQTAKKRLRERSAAAGR